MKYRIKHEKTVNRVVTETINHDFNTEKKCRKEWVKLLRELFLVQCCKDGKFLTSNFHEMATEWVIFWNYDLDRTGYSVEIQEIKE